MAGPRPSARQYTTRLNAFEQAASWSFTSCFASGPDGPLPIEYERHEPEKTLLHEVVREQLEPFLARARRDGAPVARFVERELRAFLGAGAWTQGPNAPGGPPRDDLFDAPVGAVTLQG